MSKDWMQHPAEPLADYVKRLEAEKARQDQQAIVKVLIGGPSLNGLLRDAKKRLRAMRGDLKKTPATREVEAAARGASPALREIMRLFAQLSDGERQEFFLWYTSGMPRAANSAPTRNQPSDTETARERDHATRIAIARHQGPGRRSPHL